MSNNKIKCSKDIENKKEKETEDFVQKLEKDVSEFSEKLKEQKNKSDEYLCLLQKTQADFQNYKKRIQKEIDDNVFINMQKTLIDFLKFRNTLKQAYEKETNQQFKESILSLLNNYDNILRRQNIQTIDCLKKDFNYNLCECVFKKKVDTKENNNKVIEVLEDGYLLNNKLIIPAKVVVGVMEE
jgi:molecular chaperone GrpE